MQFEVKIADVGGVQKKAFCVKNSAVQGLLVRAPQCVSKALMSEVVQPECWPRFFLPSQNQAKRNVQLLVSSLKDRLETSDIFFC